MAKEIAKKCWGLPLAAICVGGLLLNTDREKEWGKILNNKSWMMEDGHVHVMEVLKMSYHFLSPQLKHCFGWFAMLPEDYRFTEHEIVLRWIGMGVVPSTEGEKCKEEVARDCFEQLLSRSLFSQILNNDKGYRKTLYIMHDFVRNLAIEVFGMDHFIGRCDKLPKSFKTARHIFCDDSRFKEVVDVLVMEKETVLPLRTFHKWSYTDGRYQYDEQIKQCTVEDILLKLKYIRAISFAFLNELPQRFFGQLTLLRYLHLSYCYFTRLPNSVTLLYNLEVFILKDCRRLVELPESIGNLINLSHLSISFCYLLTKLPTSIGKLQKLCYLEVSYSLSLREVPAEIGLLQNLRYLDVSGSDRLKQLPDGIGELQNLHDLDVSNCNDLKIPSLKNLTVLETVPNFTLSNNSPLSSLDNLKILEGSLKISGLEKVTSPEDATLARLSEKKLSKLYLEWDAQRDLIDDIQVEGEILDLLQPHQYLEGLMISGYGGSKFPNWLIGSLRNLTALVLWSCKNCIAPATKLNMPSLEYLCFAYCPLLILKLHQILPDLLSLISLSISEFSSNVLKLILAVQLPSLKELELEKCPDIVTFPSEDMEMDSVRLTSSLRVLSIRFFQNLKRISSSQVLGSVSRLEFKECEALETFPDEGLPFSVKELFIIRCPLLETRFPKKKDKELPFEVIRTYSDE